MRVREARHDAAPIQVDALVGDTRVIALAHVDAAADDLIGDRQRTHQRQPCVPGAHAAVVQDHVAEGSSAKWHMLRVPLGPIQASDGARALSPIGTRRECHLAASRRPPRPSLSSPSVLPPPPPAEEIDRRIAAFQAGLQRDGIDAALIVQSADLVYLSGTAQNAHLIVPAVGESLLLVRRDLERARRESAVRRIEPFTSLRALPAALSACGLPERLRLGFELDVVPAAAYLRYCELVPGADPVDCMPALWSARSLKSAWEVERIRLACEQTRLAMEYAPQVLVPGRPECDVLSELGHHMRHARPRGHDPLSRHQQRVSLRPGTRRGEWGRAGPDRNAAARAQGSRLRRGVGPPGARCVAAMWS